MLAAEDIRSNANVAIQPPNKQKLGGDLVIASLLPGAPRLPLRRLQYAPRVSTVPHYSFPSSFKSVRKQQPLPSVQINIGKNADLIWSGGYQDAFPFIEMNDAVGTAEQMLGPLGRDRELVVGLDFGTSSVKVVVGDRGAGKAYAVPFLDAPGVAAYLLPSRLYEQNGDFSLVAGAQVHRDLKLQFLANSSSKMIQETLVGFLALVIRRSRSWLFDAQADTLVNRHILWKLVLGRAIDRVSDDPVGNVMKMVLHAAWAVAGQSGSVTRLACRHALLACKSGTKSCADEPELSVVPELAAQIYGFVKSRQFDPKAKNFYLFVDVGAGTVDVSLFRVKPNEFGTWDFSLFTSVVQPNGVINLHRARLAWWRKQLERKQLEQVNLTQVESLLQKIACIQTPTEQIRPVPHTYLDYFKGIDLQYIGTAQSPDDLFYDRKLVAQVRGQGIVKTVQERIVGRVDLDHLPFFLCGGGSRLPLYRNLSSALDQAAEFSWLKAHRRELGVPSELVAPGLAQVDYDRLSVAFGLSFVDVGSVAIAQAMPKIKQRASVNWHSDYLDKDQC